MNINSQLANSNNNSRLPSRNRMISNYILLIFIALNTILALFLPAFIRLKENPRGMLEEPIIVIESFWQFSVLASILLIFVAIAGVLIVVTKRSRKLILVALAFSLVYFGAMFLHERAKQAKLDETYLTKDNSGAILELRLISEKLSNTFGAIERSYIMSESYGQAWKLLFLVFLGYWIGGLVQFNKTDYQNAWEWIQSKLPAFTREMKLCRACGRTNSLGAGQCQYCKNYI